jgi:ornithine carbamoyltransferase
LLPVREIAKETGARITITENIEEAVKGVAISFILMYGYQWEKQMKSGRKNRIT